MTPLKPLRLTGNMSYLKCIGHQAPTHLRIRPLSLQNAGDACVPMGVITLFDWKNSLGILVRYKDLDNKEQRGRVKDAGLYMLWVEDLENKDGSRFIRYEDLVPPYDQQ